MMAQNPSDLTFVVDSMLGKVAKWLRILGYDAVLTRLAAPSQLLRWTDQGRLIVTRSRRWQPAERVIVLTADRLEAQMRQLIAHLDLTFDRSRVLTRCPRCNTPLQPISRPEVETRVPDAVLAAGYLFRHCPDCGRIYWPGTHPQRILNRLNRFWTDPIQQSN